ncbi:MAG: lipopolysaccharide assembly protein LapA domain-containing protein, partial [Acidimicrobiia bacterium]
VVENDGPVVEKDGPVVEKDGPVVEKDGPVVEKDGPVAERGGAEQALAASQADLAKLRLVRRARLIKAAILTFIALILITFVLQNAHPVGVQLAFWTVSVGLIWVIVASVLLGAVAGYLVGRPDKELLLHGPSRRQEDPR